MENQKEFKICGAEYGKFGGGTQPPVYLDEKGKPKPFKKTKWAKLAKKNNKLNQLKKGV